MSAIYKSRLPQIEAELVAKMDAVAKAVAERTEQAAEERVVVATGRLKGAIHTDHTGEGEYSVIAGDNNAFYAHIIEHGSVHVGARPFLVPALEQVRQEVPAIAKTVLRSL
ncbi:MAG TPA: HK97-gp10 family putative phage morphogenesis protein [Vicinamibacterales bacterium]|nr:HK97-gp10 family putative phage morphogenesis protein [Vicinamibacterales bacterium]